MSTSYGLKGPSQPQFFFVYIQEFGYYIYSEHAEEITDKEKEIKEISRWHRL